MHAYRRFTGASRIYWLISVVIVDRIRCTHYTPKLSSLALFGRRRVTHEPPKGVPLGAGWPLDIPMKCALSNNGQRLFGILPFTFKDNYVTKCGTTMQHLLT